MNQRPFRARGRIGRIVWVIAIAAWFATVHGAEAGHPAPNLPGLGPLATAFVTLLGALVFLGGVVIVVIVVTRRRSPP